MNYKIGEYVIYNGLEVCKIGENVIREFDGEKLEYMTLYPTDINTTIYIPAEKCGSLLRPMLSREELLRIIDMIPDISEQGRDSNIDFAEAVKSGDHKSILAVMSSIYARGQKRAKDGKTLFKTDRRNFDIAKKIIHNEIAYSFGIKPSDAEKFISDRIEEKKMKK
ncbi:MAG: hypothetical protein J6B01_10055 [Ruminococcus sp.]|nr:hypothetical protein [Ruminococcus sp.]MBP3379581.1 hypothetical protein [Ruminococcus sp.]